jgi:hypothetical protein
VAFHGSAIDVHTEDIGPRGCQIVAPRPHRRGEPVDVLVGSQLVARNLRVTGHVAWGSTRPPFRVGIEFEQRALPSATRWFELLLRAHPGMPARARIPDRIPLDAMVFLAQPPRFLVDFSADEVAILRQVASGITVEELKLRLRDRWANTVRALFSLLARQHVTLTRSSSVPPDSWKQILADSEATLALEALEHGAPAGRVPARPALPRGAILDLPAPATRAPRGSVRSMDRGATWTAPPVARPQEAGAETGPGRPGFRCAESQGCFERALVELDAERVEGAISLLRRALALAPGDAEIGRVLRGVASRKR